jgi:hypothetical protein
MIITLRTKKQGFEMTVVVRFFDINRTVDHQSLNNLIDSIWEGVVSNVLCCHYFSVSEQK